MIAFFQLLGGLVLLIYAGDALVRGSVSMARRLNVSPIIIGLTIVAFGTSAPELMVGIDAVLTKVPTLALGNVVGSNIANIWLVIGLPAVIAPMICHAHRLTTNMAVMLLATIGFIALAFTGDFTSTKGMVLLGGLFIFLLFSTKKDKKEPTYQDILGDMEGLPKKPDSFRVSALIIMAGLVGLGIGAHFFVAGAVDFARMLGVSEAVIGLTLVAFGTSIPELVTAIAASLHRQCDIAIGNVIGSNIFNLLGIIGISSLFGTIPVPAGFLDFDLWVMLFASLTFLPFVLQRKNVSRNVGLLFCLAYIIYIYIVFLAQGAPGIDSMNLLAGFTG